MSNYDDKFDDNEQSLDGVAIIGMSGRFPGSKNVQEFWENLKNGVESISVFTDEELQHVDPSLLNDPRYVKAGGVFEDKALFDAGFFDFTPREAEITDPQHRVFLECAHEALEVAGYHTQASNNRVGVFAGVTTNGYVNHVLSNQRLVQSLGELQVNIGTGPDFLATRVSYKLNLNGPAMTVQTACSTSLVAVHQACQNLLMMECDMALAGGASLRASHKEGYLYQEGGIHSPDGHCRSFDADAQGTVGGEGVGVVLLKRLADALADGDTIYAVIKGSAINNDGSQKIGYTAPSVDGQAEVIAEALAVAGVSPETIGYVEAHGTATPLGDPIEIAALTQAYRASTEKKGYCAIGSAKSNIGHLDAAAGVTGLMKAALALKHGYLPPSLHFESPNPKLDLENSPFFVNNHLTEWKKGASPRRAGVSSFGIGGTNAHVILEESPTVEASSPSREQQLLVLSAKTATALDTATTNLTEHVKQHPEQSLADVAYTLQTGRRTCSHRRLVVVRDHADAVQTLEALDPARVLTHQQEEQVRSVVFMFPGQGAQYVNMGLELYEKESVFQEQVDRCAELLKPHLGLDLREVLFPQAEQAETAKQRLAQTMYTQPAIFVIEYALAKLWQEWGVTPAAMIGHSIGEYVAACLAGVMLLEDALVLVATRGKLMQELPGGSMLAIPLPEAEVTPMLGAQLSLAVVNGPSACVVSGTNEAVEALVKQLEAQGIVHHRLDTSHAFHSEMMEPILEKFTEVVRGIKLHAPNVPYLSNVTGTWVTADEATNPSYWTMHLRQTVRFAEGVRELLNEPGRLLLEVGPGRVLGTLAGQQIRVDSPNAAVALYSLRHRDEQQSDLAFLLGTLGKLWVHGLQVEWTRLYAEETRQRVALPTYPFERKYYWVEPGNGVSSASQEHGKKTDLADWFYIPVWKRSLPPELFESLVLNEQEGLERVEHKASWLVFLDACGFGTQLVKRLEQEGHEVVSVVAGDAFAKAGERSYTIDPQSRQAYSSLLEAVAEAGHVPQQIFHLWGVTAVEDAEVAGSSASLKDYEKTQHLGFYSLLYLAQALGEQNMRDSFRIGVVTNNLQDVIGEEVVVPERATMFGACKVIPQEYTNITTRSIDVELPKTGSRAEEMLLDSLVTELRAQTNDTFVAYRRNHRLVRTFDEAKLNGINAKGTTAKNTASANGTTANRMAFANRTTANNTAVATIANTNHTRITKNKRTNYRDGATYLITGATEPNGLTLAEHLAQSKQAKLVLLAQTAFPSSDAWQNHLDTHAADDAVSQTIHRLRAIESLGHGVLCISADVTDLAQMQQAIDQAHGKFGDIHGVFHTVEVKGSGLMQLKTADRVASVLGPKVKGTRTLEAALSKAEPDFFVLFSSTSSILGGLGQVDSAAANAFLDAYAHHRTEQGHYTVAINWSTWQWDDWLEVQSAGVPEFQQQLRDAREQYGISFSEGMEALSRILTSSLPQVVVSTQDFHAVIDVQGTVTASSYLEAVEEARRGQGQDDVSDRDYLAPTNETEQTLAELWQEIFGVKQVGLHDNFFELGGNSLVAIQLITRMRQKFKMDFLINVIFESPSIAGLAQVIAGKQVDHEQLDKLEQMLREIEALSLQEVKSKLETIDSPESHASSSATAEAILSSQNDTEGRANTALSPKIDTSNGMQFSLYFFSGDGSTGAEQKYDLLLDSAKFADQHGYTAVWTPERHFQDFGGLYPNPSVVSAALAVLTERVQIRAGSVAIPLHHPIRVCEEWSVVDNLSRGRVAICCASGWHPVDFILSPQPTLSYYEQRKQVMAESIRTIRRLWAGESMTVTGIDGDEVNVRVLPKPVQPEVPIWIASQGSPETFVQAGELGANILTGIVNQPLPELAEKISLYRESLAKHGHDPDQGQVTVMLHTFLGEDNAVVKEQVRKPLTRYLRTFIKQQENFSNEFELATEADKEALVSFAFERYFNESTLLGTPEKCTHLIDSLIGIGVDEVACLIDFGVDSEAVLESLHHLNVLKEGYPLPTGGRK